MAGMSEGGLENVLFEKKPVPPRRFAEGVLTAVFSLATLFGSGCVTAQEQARSETRAEATEQTTAERSFKTGQEWYYKAYYDKAATEFKTAYEQNHDNRTGYWCIDALCADGKIDEAEKLLEKLEGNWKTAARGMILNYRGDFTKAEKKLREAILNGTGTKTIEEAMEEEKGESEWWSGYSFSLRSSGNIPTAVASARIAVTCTPTNVNAYVNLARALIKDKKYEEATRACREGLETFPLSVDLLANAGSAYAWQGKTDLARKEYEKALKLHPGNTKIRSYLDAITSR